LVFLVVTVFSMSRNFGFPVRVDFESNVGLFSPSLLHIAEPPPSGGRLLI
jgi:hypothetical protein